MLSCLAVERFQVGEVAIELPCICTNKGIAFPHLANRVKIDAVCFEIGSAVDLPVPRGRAQRTPL